MLSIVGVCPVCGGYVIAAREHGKKQFCSKGCANKFRRERQEEPMRLKRLRKLRAEEHAEMLERLHARDEEYAKVAPVVKVEIRGGVRIETRGAAVIGARAVGMVKHY